MDIRAEGSDSPVVDAMVNAALADPATTGLSCDVAVAIRLSDPCAAKPVDPIVIGMVCELPAASVTWVWPSVAATAAGPPSARVNVSLVVPVLVTFIWKPLLAVPEEGLSVTPTPAETAVSVAERFRRRQTSWSSTSP